MRKPAVLAALAVTLLIACGTSTVMPSYQELTGAYWCAGSAASSGGLEMTLTLNDDLSAGMSSDYLNGQPPIVETGTWLIEGDGTVTVRLSETGGVSMYPIITLVFNLDGTRLKSISWDRTLYGSEGLSMERI
jgi:hypothetical protein